MKAYLREFFDSSSDNRVVLAVIWVQIISLEANYLDEARKRLNNYVLNYVGNRGYNLYSHTEKDTVSVTITFSTDNYPSNEIRI